MKTVFPEPELWETNSATDKIIYKLVHLARDHVLQLLERNIAVLFLLQCIVYWHLEACSEKKKKLFLFLNLEKKNYTESFELFFNFWSSGFIK